MDAANLFIIPLDNKRYWYRYHHLFAELLQQRLRQRDDLSIAELHRRAAVWHQETNLIESAVYHYLQAESWGAAAELIAQKARGMLARGEGRLLGQWLADLPDSALYARPWLNLMFAAAHTLVRDVPEVAARLDIVEESLADSAVVQQLTALEVARSTGGIAIYRAMLALWQGDTPRTIALSYDGLDQLEGDDSYLPGLATYLLGSAFRIEGQWRKAHHAYQRAAALASRVTDLMLSNMIANGLAEVAYKQGKLQVAFQSYQQTLDHTQTPSGTPLPVAAGALLGLASVYYEWNDLARAQECLMQAVQLHQQSGIHDPTFAAEILRARLHQARSEWTSAHTLLQQAEATAMQHEQPMMMPLLTAWRVRLWLAQGTYQPAIAWCKAHMDDADHNLGEWHEFVQLTLIRVQIALWQQQNSTGNYAEVLALLAQLDQAATEAERVNSQIEIGIVQALTLAAQGEVEAAISPLTVALTLAEQEGHVRLFIDEGRKLGRLLLQLHAQGYSSDHLKKVLTAFPETKPTTTANAVAQPTVAHAMTEELPALIEPLSLREQEVLQLLSDGLSNREIAQQLVIAASTVKRHTINIYGKLGVNSRTKAVARARLLNLL